MNNIMDASLAENREAHEYPEVQSVDFVKHISHLELMEAGCMDSDVQNRLEPIYVSWFIKRRQFYIDTFEYTEDEANDMMNVDADDVLDAKNKRMNKKTISSLMAEFEKSRKGMMDNLNSIFS